MRAPDLQSFLNDIQRLKHMLEGTQVATSHLSGQDIKLDGQLMRADDIFMLPLLEEEVTLIEFCHLFSIFNSSRVHYQQQHDDRKDSFAGHYYTVVNRKLIQGSVAGKNRFCLYLSPESDARLHITNLHIDRFFLAEDAVPGLGSVSFALSAIAAYKLGFTSITLIAAGGKRFHKKHVGYKVWPRFGFDAPVDETDVCEDARFSSYTRVQEVMANDEALWEEHGSQRMMQFDLSASSASWGKLLPYIAQKLQILSSNHEQTLRNPSPEGRPQTG